MTKRPFKVSQSKIKLYQRCRRAYYWKYVMGLRKRRVKRPFTFGSIVHSMLEEYANGGDPFEILNEIEKKDGKKFKRELEEYGDIISDVRDIMSSYFDYWESSNDSHSKLFFLRRGKKLAEHDFEIEIAPQIIFNGKIDGVVKTQNKLKWVLEHKSFKKMPSEDFRWRNIQSSVYIRAIQMLGWWDNISGMCWDYVRSKPPTTPTLTKAKKISSKQILTLPITVERFLEENRMESELLEEMGQNGLSQYFSRVFTPINSSVVDSIFKGFVDLSKEVADNHGTKNDMCIDQHCSYCDYEPLCRALMTNSDVDFVIKREYVNEDEIRESPKELSEESGS